MVAGAIYRLHWNPVVCSQNVFLPSLLPFWERQWSKQGGSAFAIILNKVGERHEASVDFSL